MSGTAREWQLEAERDQAWAELRDLAAALAEANRARTFLVEEFVTAACARNAAIRNWVGAQDEWEATLPLLHAVDDFVATHPAPGSLWSGGNPAGAAALVNLLTEAGKYRARIYCPATVQKAGEDPQECGLERPCPTHDTDDTDMTEAEFDVAAAAGAPVTVVGRDWNPETPS